MNATEKFVAADAHVDAAAIAPLPNSRKIHVAGSRRHGRALHALRGSALTLDIYVWLAHRLHRLDHQPLWLPWRTVKLQFGCDYEGKHGHGDFCRSFKLALRRVLILYPTAWVCVKRGGIELRQSEPPVPPRTWLTSETHRPRTHQALKNKEAA